MEKQKWMKELRNTYNHAIITQMRKLVLLKQPNMMQICFYTSPIIPLLLNEIQNKTHLFHCMPLPWVLIIFASSPTVLQSFLWSHHIDILTRIDWPVVLQNARSLHSSWPDSSSEPLAGIRLWKCIFSISILTWKHYFGYWKIVLNILEDRHG